jgi:hypothetical protein
MSLAVLLNQRMTVPGVRFSLGSFLYQENLREDNDTRCHL